MHHFSRTVVRNSTLNLVAQLVIKLFSFGFSVLIVRNLGAEVYGQYAAVLAFGAIFIFLADLGLSPYTVREVARWREASDSLERINIFYGNILFLRLSLATLAALLLVVAAWCTGRPLIMIGAIALNAFGLIIYGVQGSSDAMLAGFERLDFSAQAKILYQLVFVSLGTVALLLGLGYYGLIYATLTAVIVLTAICWVNANRLGIYPRHPIIRDWPALLRASLPFGIIGFTLGLSYKFDSVLLNIFWGDAETGYYNAAYNLVFSTAILSNVINTSLYPSLSRQAVSAPETLRGIYERALRYLLIIGFPIAVGAWALADQIIPFLFKATYMPAIPALQIVIWVVPLMFASEFLGYVVVVAGSERRVARAVIISTGINIAINLLLVPRFGLRAAAIMTVVTEAVLVGQYVWLLRDMLRDLNWTTILLRPALAVLLMAGVALTLRELPLLINIAASGLVYGGALFVLGVIGPDELRFVQNLRRRVPESQQAEG